jgi:hypothetical protein
MKVIIATNAKYGPVVNRYHHEAGIGAGGEVPNCKRPTRLLLPPGSEGLNAVLKYYMNPKNSILDFVQQYNKIQ